MEERLNESDTSGRTPPPSSSSPAVASNAVLESTSKGASMIEYSLLAALIAAVCVTALALLGTQTSSTFSKAASGFGL